MDDERLLHLREEQWAQIEGAFPQRRGWSGLKRKINNRQAFEAVLHRARVGCPWRVLAENFYDLHYAPLAQRAALLLWPWQPLAHRHRPSQPPGAALHPPRAADAAGDEGEVATD